MLTKLTRSIRGLHLLMVLGLVATIAVAVLFTQASVDRHYRTTEGKALADRRDALDTKARALGYLLSVREASISGIASERQLAAMFSSATTAELEQWALDQQRHVVNSVGFALILPDGTIAGEPGLLRVAEACIRDIRHAINGAGSARPPVHPGVPGAEHFDVLKPVRDEAGTVVGYVFASYSLTVFRDWLETFSEPDAGLVLTDAEGEVLATVGILGFMPEPVVMHSMIPDTQLSVAMVFPRPVMSAFQREMLIIGLLTLALVSFITVSGSTRVWRLLRDEFNYISEVLVSLSQGRLQTPRRTKPLHETRDIIDGIDSVAMEISTLQEEMRYLSLHDPLTGLANRRLLNEELERVCALARRGSSFVVAIVDIDHFKRINDDFGHAEGDTKLKLFADCARNSLRDADIAARYAGDEFVLILFESGTTSQSSKAIERLQQCFALRQMEQGKNNRVATLSIGTVHVTGGRQYLSETIIRDADAALYEAKRQGRDLVIDYSELE